MKSFLEWLKFNEMALGNTFVRKVKNADGEERADIGFGKNDEKILSRMFPKIKEKLKSFLKGLDFVDIHMYFGMLPIYDWDDTPETKTEKTNKYFFDGETFHGNNLGVKIPKSDIVFVKESTFADSLTPWMMLHTFAHAVFDSVEKGTFIHAEYPKKIRPELMKAVNSSLGIMRYLKNKLSSEELYMFFPMGSLRKLIDKQKGKKVQSRFDLIEDELYREMFVYYLTKGGKIPTPSGYREMFKSNKRMDNEIDEILLKVQSLSDQLRNVLEACRGDVVIDTRSNKG